MTAKEMARLAVTDFLNESGESSGRELAFSDRCNPAYDTAWNNFLNLDHEETIQDFGIVEEWVHHFLLWGV